MPGAAIINTGNGEVAAAHRAPEHLGLRRRSGREPPGLDNPIADTVITMRPTRSKRSSAWRSCDSGVEIELPRLVAWSSPEPAASATPWLPLRAGVVGIDRSEPDDGVPVGDFVLLPAASRPAFEHIRTMTDSIGQQRRRAGRQADRRDVGRRVGGGNEHQLRSAFRFAKQPMTRCRQRLVGARSRPRSMCRLRDRSRHVAAIGHVGGAMAQWGHRHVLRDGLDQRPHPDESSPNGADTPGSSPHPNRSHRRCPADRDRRRTPARCWWSTASASSGR